MPRHPLKKALDGYQFKPQVHDHFDGSAHCVECEGTCKLEGADMAYTALLRWLFEGEGLSGTRMPYLAERHLRDIGINVDQFRLRGAQTAKTLRAHGAIEL